ncbi:RNA polymerase subunit sigma [Lysobacteraceae bacterium NML08-0793]|nr:RNA polymerase subunit sigma [Xanthomonadaceae bacterium NML08-0793]
MSESSEESLIRSQLESRVPPGVQSLAALMESLQRELRQIAHWQRWRGHAGETLSTTALVNEAWLKLAGSPDFLEGMCPEHFLAVAARAMRHILINHARDRLAQKRGAGSAHVSLEMSAHEAALQLEASEMLELEMALGRLEAVRPRLAQVVMLRYFAGLGEEETGQVLGVDRSTVQRDWVKARGWLHECLG